MRERDCFDELLKKPEKSGRIKGRKKRKEKICQGPTLFGKFYFWERFAQCGLHNSLPSVQTNSKKKNIFLKNSFTL